MSDVPDDSQLTQLAEQVGDWLAKRGLSLTTAESCTGGWIAKCLTDIAGSSAWFECSLVTYSNRAKQQHLKVDSDTLEHLGAVSESTVREMASGARRFADSDLSVAVSGVAGPGGGTPEKPVGLVWFAWASSRGITARQQHFTGNREAVRRQAVAHALAGVLKFCESRD